MFDTSVNKHRERFFCESKQGDKKRCMNTLEHLKTVNYKDNLQRVKNKLYKARTRNMVEILKN